MGTSTRERNAFKRVWGDQDGVCDELCRSVTSHRQSSFECLLQGPDEESSAPVSWFINFFS